MYAITGITGQVGGALARALLAASVPVRAVLRDAAKGAAWAEPGGRGRDRRHERRRGSEDCFRGNKGRLREIVGRLCLSRKV